MNYCLVLGFLGLAVGLAAFLASEAFGFAERTFLAGAASATGVSTLTSTLLGLSGCTAHASVVKACRPTQYPEGLRPHPHFAGSGAFTSGAASTLYGASALGAS